MPFCPHCHEEATVGPDADPTICPSCGRLFDAEPISTREGADSGADPGESDSLGDLSAGDSESVEGGSDPSEAWETSAMDMDLVGGETSALEPGTGEEIELESEDLQQTPRVDSAPGGSGAGGSTMRGSDAAGPVPEKTIDLEAEADDAHQVDMTHAMGGKYSEFADTPQDDSADVIALGEADEDDGTDLEGAGDAPEDAPTYVLGDVPDFIGMSPSDPNPLIADPSAGADSGDPSAGGSDADSSRDPTLQVDQLDSGSAGTPMSGAESDRNAATIDSNTFPVGSEPSVPSRRGRPSIRQIDGVDSGDTAPQDLAGKQGPSQSIQPGDSVSIGSEQVRLKSHLLGHDDPPGAGPELTALDYQFVAGPFDGGMGRVWKSRQATLDRHVAIKQIKTDNVSQRDRDRFVSEAVITGTLEHPNIIPVHDLGLDPTGLPFYSMKFVEGVDWEDKIRDLSEAENLSILLQVAQAIAFAHSKDIIHMDLKPSNVRLGSFGEVLVMDWGLAARMAPGKEIQPGGTPMYMPPELALPLYRRYTQRTGRETSQDPTDPMSRPIFPPGTYSDIYLLGALLFKIVTGKAPHRAKRSFDVLRKAARNEITRTSRRSELLDIAYKAMATEPARRYRSAIEFIDAVKSYQDHAQSVEIARIASSEVRAAEKLRQSPDTEPKQLYESYARARHGYENALALWPENRKAERRLAKTKRVYAETAFENRDYDLALSLLDPESEKDRELHTEVVASQRGRDIRERWFKRLQYATAVSLAAALVFIAISVVLGFDAASKAREIAQFQQNVEKLQRSASDAEAKAAEAEERFTEAETNAAVAEKKAKSALAEADQQSRLATAAREDLSLAQADLRSAAQELDAANLKVEEAEIREEEASRLAEQARARADFAQVRSTLLESGPYAASKVLARVPAAIRNADTPEWNYVRQRCDWRREAEELTAPPEGGAAGSALVAVSPDRAWIVTVAAINEANRITVSSSASPTESTAQFRVDGAVHAIALSSGGKYAALLGDRLSVWECATGHRLTPQAPDELPALPGVTAVAFHPIEDRLLVGTGTTSVEEWTVDSASGGLIRLSANSLWHRAPVTAVGYSEDGSTRYSADGDGVIRVWAGDGEQSQRPWSYRHDHVSSGSSRVTALAMAERQGRVYLSYGCFDGAVYEIVLSGVAVGGADDLLVEWASTRPEKIGAAHPGSVTAVAYAQSGELILSAGGDTAMVRPAAGVVDGRIKHARRYHDQLVTTCAADDRGHGYSSDSGGRVVRWRIDVPEEDLTFTPTDATAPVVDAEWRRRDNSLFVADAAGFLRQWGVAHGSKGVKHFFVGHADHREFRAWVTEGPRPSIVSVAADGRACVWDGATGDLRRTIDLGGREVVACSRKGVLLAASARRDLDAVAISVADGSRRQLWPAGPRVASIVPTSDDGSSLAVALRDGQVYGWSAERGRLEWIPSSFRPHWRAVRAMHFDRGRGVLLTGDAGGGVAFWRVSEADGEFVERRTLDLQAPVVRVDSATGGAVLAVQRWAGVSHLSVSAGGPFEPIACDSLQDACFDHDAVLAVTRGGIARRPVTGGAWASVSTDDRRGADRDTRGVIRVGEHGLLLYGAGFAERLDLRDNRLVPSVRIDSRRRAVALGWPRDSDAVSTIDRSGRLAGWSAGGAPEMTGLARLPVEGAVLAGRRAGNPREAVLAVRGERGDLRLELWNVPRGRRLREIARGLRGDVEAMTASPQRAAVALMSERGRTLVFASLARDEPLETVALRTAVAVSDLALSPDGQRCAIVTQDRGAAVALATPEGWSLATIDRPGVTAATFSPDGERLLLGLESGQVLVLEPLGPTDDESSLATRRLLTLAGHSGPVTTLRFVAEGARLVSGDETGSVVLRTF